MNTSIAWKLVLSFLIALWAVLNLIPWNDTPFPEYAVAEATADTEGFIKLMDEAKALMESDTTIPTEYVALKRIAAEKGEDLQKYFPKYDATDIKNRTKRNDTILRALLLHSQGKVKYGLDLKGGVAFTFKVKDDDLDPNQFVREKQLEKARGILAQRVDTLGVAEPVIRLKSDNRIEVQMPGINIKDNPNAVDFIAAPALLEFRKVYRSETRIDDNTQAPLGYEKMILQREDDATGENLEYPYFIKIIPEMTGEIIEKATAVPDEFGRYRILLSFTEEGSDKFRRVTRDIAQENQQTQSIGQLAIVLDGKLYSAPTVREEIHGGAEISGDFTQRSALELQNVLNNPLEVGLDLEEMYEISAMLAADAKDASFKAAILGASLVLVFMVGYYGISGIVAILSVILNVVIVIGALASVSATLTLPGVAALVLTIGMAVDGNILIFERIREELKEGKSLIVSVITGFDKALSTIVDANVTTLITALILIGLGTGPVKGFGVTLAIGIVASMFCSLIVSRWVLELIVRVGLVKRILRFSLFKQSDFSFLNYRKPAFISSWSLVGVGIVAVIIFWGSIWGIDFTGGDEVTITFKQKPSIEEVAKVQDSGSYVDENGTELSFGEVIPIFQKEIGQNIEMLKLQTEEGKGNYFYEALEKAYPDYGFEKEGVTIIGSAIGGEVKSSAVWSIIMALGGILIYVALRFEFGYGIGAVVATIHDVLMTIGLFILLGKIFGMGSGQFTAPMIASILMIVGYSINDTIVVFDRIREELELNPGTTLKNVIHLAINKTLSRTLLTSLTTFLATFSLYIFGAGIVVDFALVFILGILTGTFSSIFIASPIFYIYHNKDRRRVEEGHFLPSYEWASGSDGGKKKSK